jgi:hypothetical protein
MITIERGLLWAVAVGVIAAAIKYGGLLQTVDGHSRELLNHAGQLETLGEMRVDIGVIKAWVERQERDSTRYPRR